METKIISFEAACAVKNHDPKADLAILEQLSEPAKSRAIANYRLDIIVPALNDEGRKKPWVADYTDYSQRKYIICLTRSAGGTWSYYLCVHWDSNVSAGARPFRDLETLENAKKYFLDDFIAAQ